MDTLPVDLPVIEQFQVGLEAARWPRFAEVAQSKGLSPLEAVINRIKKTMPELTDIKILQSGDTTAVIACDPIKGNVFIAFDPSKDRKFKPLNIHIPELFNFRAWKNDHPIGGAAHHGYSVDLEYPNKKFGYDEDGNKKNIVDSIESSILDFADNHPTTVTVTFSGFSKGGVQAVLASGHMLANGIFDNPDNIKLNNVYAFAPPNYGTDKFVESYNEIAEDKGIKVWNILISTDSLSQAFSSIYSKVGKFFSMTPEDSINEGDMTHSFNSYKHCLERIKNALLAKRSVEEPNVTNQVIGKLDL